MTRKLVWSSTVHRPPDKALVSAFFWIFQMKEYIRQGNIKKAVNCGQHCHDMLLMILMWPAHPEVEGDKNG